MALLTEPSTRYQASYLEALQEFQAEGRHLETPLEEIAADFARFVQHLRELADRTKLKPGWVPGSDFWLIDGSDYIGRLSLRHELNERLLQMGGHIISSINTPVVRNAVRTAWPGKENYDATAR
jgi:predicted acetyltransferase